MFTFYHISIVFTGTQPYERSLRLRSEKWKYMHTHTYTYILRLELQHLSIRVTPLLPPRIKKPLHMNLSLDFRLEKVESKSKPSQVFGIWNPIESKSVKRFWTGLGTFACPLTPLILHRYDICKYYLNGSWVYRESLHLFEITWTQIITCDLVSWCGFGFSGINPPLYYLLVSC